MCPVSEFSQRVRYDVITQLQKYPDEYSCYVPDNYRSYLSKMSKDGEWGDHVTLKVGNIKGPCTGTSYVDLIFE